MVAGNTIQRVTTTAFKNQKPGTSGLRKKTKEFMQTGYLENFVQAVFNSVQASEDTTFAGSTLLVSGDGRYYTKDAIHVICQIAAANSVRRVWIGVDGLISTPAASAVIREREGGICVGGFLLTASHNPGGLKEDFGIKYNSRNGGPAPESLTDIIYENTKTIDHYLMCALPPIDMAKPNKFSLLGGEFEIEILDPVEDWLKLMKESFDFDLLRRLCSRPDFSLLYDGMHGVAGPYAHSVFVKELRCEEKCLIGCTPQPDFAGGHPDPNLTYAKDLVDRMKVNNPIEADETTPNFGAAGDGDCDRNMILGRGFFVTPSDSVAILAANAENCIPYFKKHPVLGVSRSMPTSAALDKVAQKLGFKIYEVPTGWKYFGNLMDSKMISICGEESFGTGSDHIREKDGIWAVLAWLSIIASRNEKAERLIGVQQIVEEFWETYGRNYYTRYDYEDIESVSADKLMNYLRELIPCITELPNKRSDLSNLLSGSDTQDPIEFTHADEFAYTDPVDGSLTTQQGLRFFMKDGARIIYRLSGTGSQGATVRVYVERFVSEKSKLLCGTKDMLKRYCALAVELCQLEAFTGRIAPTVIT